MYQLAMQRLERVSHLNLQLVLGCNLCPSPPCHATSYVIIVNITKFLVAESSQHLDYFCSYYYSTTTTTDLNPVFRFPTALHEMLGSVGSNPSSTTEPPSAAEPTAANSSPHQTYGSFYHSSSSGGLMQLRDLLLETAQYISQCDWDRARPLLEVLSRHVSSTGDSSERVASCFLDALAIRFSKVTGTEITELLPAASAQEPTSEEILSAYLALNQVTPFMRFAHLTANQALLEGLTGEDFVHIVDLDIGHGVQWPPFLQALADLRGEEGYVTMQHIRITGVSKDVETLERTGARLVDFAQSIHLPFEFIPLVQPPENLVPNMLDLRMGEAVAINCMLQLHRLLAKGPEKLTSFLCMLESLTPKIITLAELEASHDQSHFLDRFAEALSHYSTLFDTLEATLPPTSTERSRVEQTWYKMEIVNIVACDGSERTVRHRRFEEWRDFFVRSGFQLKATSRFAISQARLLLRLHYPSDGYRLVEDDDGCFSLGWQDHPLFCVSSWLTSTM